MERLVGRIRLSPSSRHVHLLNHPGFALGRCALEVLFGARAGAAAPAAAAFKAYASFTQRTWEDITVWSFKQAGYPAGDARISADQMWQSLLQADIPRQSVYYVQALEQELARLPDEPVAALVRRMISPDDHITLKEAAQIAQTHLLEAEGDRLHQPAETVLLASPSDSLSLGLCLF